ncbi:heme-binding domain-containing protein [Aliarcobacter butzleri]|uniref:heme-binding domain-containing protein n=1 Tax=Aliarcobacter butzleri TaxID=28197 RepID=UPI001EDBE5DE|nr:heme-binding domain-containing protein [Aliarcobacter butzleri]MCG3687608.1 heme-binding domain-containing protein [Aliarcobacter butzleri]MCT7569605.1 heme-binding domain-containing protein [Aliarcobacter butzleri]MCT7631765.1 heme-binding domain-containing protein [Aliarcobacter butzleri]
MKRFLLILLGLFLVIQLIPTSKENEVVDKSLEITAEEGIMDILRTACYDCHSNETVYPWYSYIAPFSWTISKHVKEGKKALNFSIWETYTEKEKEEHLKDIYRTIYAAMPLQPYLLIHTKANISSEDRKVIRDWTGVRR